VMSSTASSGWAGAGGAAVSAVSGTLSRSIASAAGRT
jgi:hypothetical protein